MFGLFKKMFCKPADATAPAVVPDETQSAPSVPLAPAPESGPVVERPVAPPPAALAPPAAALTTPPADSAAEPVRPASDRCVTLVVNSILSSLPEDVRTKLVLRQREKLFIPVDRLVPQLARGELCLQLDELRQLAPDVFDGIRNHDTAPVYLPLADVLRQIKPSDYSRRPAQKQVVVPDEVTGLFGQKGQMVAIAQTIFKAEPAKAAPLKPAPPAPTAAPALTRTPSALSPQPTPSLPTTPSSSPGPHAPQMISPGSVSSARPAMPKPAEACPKPVATPSNASPAMAGTEVEVLRVSLAQISKTWPDEVRRDLGDLNPANTAVALPLNMVEQALKSGQVLFPWNQLREWIEAAVPVPTPTPATGEMLVELPLKVIAPLFVARYKPAGASRKLDVDRSIPDLFGKHATTQGGFRAPGGTQPSTRIKATGLPGVPAVSGAPAAPSPASSAAAPSLSAVAPAPGSVPPSATEPKIDLETIIGPAGQRFPAREIVQNVVKLPGVVGGMLVMSDGLLVTSSVPPPIKSELVAAFLPQIYGRMGQYTRELNMGGLRCLAFSVECGSWQVIKQTNIYFAVLCKADKVVSQMHLASIAAELNNQQ